MGGSASTHHCAAGWVSDSEMRLDFDGSPFCRTCAELENIKKTFCSCAFCEALRVGALPEKVDDQVCCQFLYGCDRKTAGRLFNSQAWEASKDPQGFVSRAQLLDPQGLLKARMLGDVARFGAEELAEVGADLRGDLEFMQRCVAIDPAALDYAEPQLLSASRPFVRTAVTSDGGRLAVAVPQLRADKATVLAAVRQNGHALQFASEALRGDRDVVSAAIEGCGPALEHASEAMRGDKATVLAAVRDDRSAIRHASTDMRADPAVAAAAIAQHGAAIADAAAPVREDRAVALLALQRNGDALKHLPAAARDDRDLVIVAVQQSGAALRYASQRVRRDPGVVAAAVAQAGAWVSIYSSKPELRAQATVSRERPR